MPRPKDINIGVNIQADNSLLYSGEILALEERFCSEDGMKSLFSLFGDNEITNIYSKHGNTATINITGTLGVKSFFGTSTTYAQINDAVNMALNDDDINNVKYIFNSGGGAVTGVSETADLMSKLADAKYCEGFIDGCCGSACYWLAVQGGIQLTASKHSSTGSIGVYNLVVDDSEAYKDEKIKITLVASGDEKGRPQSGVEITDKVINRMQGKIDSIAEDFFATVLKGRGQLKGKDVFQGASFLSKEALKLGLIDRIGGLSNFNKYFRGNVMAEEQKKDEVKAEETAVFDAQLEASKVEGKTEGFEEGKAFVYEQFEAMQKAFADNKEFALKCFSEKKEVVDAEKEYLAVLRDENQKLRDSKAVENIGASAVESNQPADSQAKVNVVDMAKARVEETGVTLADALKWAHRELNK